MQRTTVISPKFKVGQYWLGLRREPEPRRPFIRYITKIEGSSIQYKVWSSVEPTLPPQEVYWNGNGWEGHDEEYLLREIPETKALMLVGVWNR